MGSHRLPRAECGGRHDARVPGVAGGPRSRAHRGSASHPRLISLALQPGAALQDLPSLNAAFKVVAGHPAARQGEVALAAPESADSFPAASLAETR